MGRKGKKGSEEDEDEDNAEDWIQTSSTNFKSALFLYNFFLKKKDFFLNFHATIIINFFLLF